MGEWAKLRGISKEIRTLQTKIPKYDAIPDTYQVLGREKGLEMENGGKSSSERLRYVNGGLRRDKLHMQCRAV